MGKKGQPLEKDRNLQNNILSKLPLQKKINSKSLKSLNLKFYQMKKNVIFLLPAFFSLSLFAKTTVSEAPNPVFGVFAKTLKGEKVSPLIESKFKKQYGNLVNVSWSIIDDESDEHITIATFTEAGEEKEVYYYEDGEILGIGKNIRRDLLPENVVRSLNARFTSGIIQTAYEFKERSSSPRYFVRLITPKHTMIVSANEFGETRVYQKEKLRHIFE